MKIDFSKGDGLVPVIIQDSISQQVLMLGYMNEEAFEKTIAEKRVTFFSRSKNRLWTKGETSGNYLDLVSYSVDCDQDTLLIQALPNGPTCHTGATTCFNETSSKGFVYSLENIIQKRLASQDENSYTVSLTNRGINKVAQKVGEEAVELVIEAMQSDNDELFLGEAADLLFHYTLLLQAKGFTLSDVESVLQSRNK